MTIADDKIVVKSGDEVIVFVGTLTQHSIQSDNEELVAAVKQHMVERTLVPIVSGRPYFLVPAGKDSYLSVIAALFAVNPSNSFLLEAPNRVMFEFNGYRAEGPSFFLS